MASYRYRAETPARLLGWEVNDYSANILIFSKPQEHELALCEGKKVIVDFCDDHFWGMPHYTKFLERADKITCSTNIMQDIIKDRGFHAEHIPETWEFEEKYPHCFGSRLLWFGHATNLKSLKRATSELEGHPLRIVSNAEGCMPWSHKTMVREFAHADIVILPKTADYKSPNRAVESIRQGCFVVAEPHPSLEDFPIWKGNIREGIEWASQNLPSANEMTRKAQSFIRERFSPEILVNAWRKVLGSISEPGRSNGPDGLQQVTGVTSTATCANYP